MSLPGTKRSVSIKDATRMDYPSLQLAYAKLVKDYFILYSAINVARKRLVQRGGTKSNFNNSLLNLTRDAISSVKGIPCEKERWLS